jgi:hypothetical protein
MRLNHTIFAREERLTIAWRLRSALMLSEEGYDRTCIMALTVQQIQSMAHVSLVLGVLRRLEVATVIDRLIPPHPAHIKVQICVMIKIDFSHMRKFPVNASIDES